MTLPSVYVQTNASPDAFMALATYFTEYGPFNNVTIQVSGGTHPGRKIQLHEAFMELVARAGTIHGLISHFAGLETTENFHYEDTHEDRRSHNPLEQHAAIVADLTSNDVIIIMDVPKLFIQAQQPVKAVTYLYASHLFALEPTVETFNQFKALFVTRLNLYSAISIEVNKGDNVGVYAPATQTPITQFITEQLNKWNGAKMQKAGPKLERLRAIKEPTLKEQQELQVQINLVESLKTPGQFPIAATMIVMAEPPQIPVVLAGFNGRYPVWGEAHPVETKMYAHEWRPLEQQKKERRERILEHINE